MMVYTSSLGSGSGGKEELQLRVGDTAQVSSE